MRRLSLALLAATPLWLAGCDMLGLESATETAARREAEGKAIGGACRHAARSIEACYEQNKRADKAAVFAGWREMNDYMRENKLEPMPAAEATKVAEAQAARSGGEGDEASESKADAKAAGKSEAKADTKADAKAEARTDSKPAKAAPRASKTESR
jgi:hypothetical protein